MRLISCTAWDDRERTFPECELIALIRQEYSSLPALRCARLFHLVFKDDGRRMLR